jgi:hypothetical protein
LFLNGDGLVRGNLPGMQGLSFHADLPFSVAFT